MNKRIMILTGSMVDCQNHASLDAVVGLRYLSCFLVHYLSIVFMVISYHEGSGVDLSNEYTHFAISEHFL